jgi:hypothetical protein
VTTFAETIAVPAFRAALERLAADQNEGLLDHHRPECLAGALRMLCPVDEAIGDTEVLGLFGELCKDVAVRDAVAAGEMPWCSVVPEASGDDRDGQALDAAQDRVNDTLAKLIPGSA